MDTTEVSISIANTHKRVGKRLADDISVIFSASERLSSPDAVELIVWNVLVAFFVNIAASAAYPKLSSWLSENGRLTLLNLQAAESEVNAIVILHLKANQDQARLQIIGVLAEHGVGEDDQAQIADRVITILSEEMK
ncbi:MAG: hypothetical protein HONDAALG_02623 [Gammaproteobacteria bacterium]|nr:hypothetical protein [Gammaproteobacteria bacterium]